MSQQYPITRLREQRQVRNNIFARANKTFASAQIAAKKHVFIERVRNHLEKYSLTQRDIFNRRRKRAKVKEELFLRTIRTHFDVLKVSEVC